MELWDFLQHDPVRANCRSMYDKVRACAWVFSVMLGVVSTAQSARAEDRWSAPHPALRSLHRRNANHDTFVVIADVSNPELRVVSTRQGEAPMRAGEFAEVYDAVVAVPNAMVGESLPRWIVRDGRAMGRTDGDTALPRSAVGMTLDGRTMVFASVDRATDADLAAVMLEFGCAAAVDVAEGDGSAMRIEGEVPAHAAGKRDIASAAHIGVRVLPGAVGWAAELVATRAVETDAHGARPVEVWVRNTGRETWDVDSANGSPRARWSDGRESFIATLSENTPPGAVGRFIAEWVPPESTPLTATQSLSLSFTDPLGRAMLGPEVSTVTVRNDSVAHSPSHGQHVHPAARAKSPTPSPRVERATVLAGLRAGPGGLAWACLGVLAWVCAALRRERRWSHECERSGVRF